MVREEIVDFLALRDEPRSAFLPRTPSPKPCAHLVIVGEVHRHPLEVLVQLDGLLTNLLERLVGL